MIESRLGVRYHQVPGLFVEHLVQRDEESVLAFTLESVDFVLELHRFPDASFAENNHHSALM
jgi:hypothetical protein